MIINMFLTIGRTGQFTLVATIICLGIIYFRNNIKYFIYTSLLFRVSDILIFGKLRNLPKKCENSCNTPYGQSHPQKVPLPQITNETKTKNQIIREKGSYNKKVKLREFRRAFKTPSTVTRLN